MISVMEDAIIGLFNSSIRVRSNVWGSHSEVCSFLHILQRFPWLSILNSCKQWMIYEDATAGRAISCSYCTPRPLWIMALSVVRPRVCRALLKRLYWPPGLRLCGRPESIDESSTIVDIYGVLTSLLEGLNVVPFLSDLKRGAFFAYCINVRLLWCSSLPINQPSQCITKHRYKLILLYVLTNCSTELKV